MDGLCTKEDVEALEEDGANSSGEGVRPLRNVDDVFEVVADTDDDELGLGGYSCSTTVGDISAEGSAGLGSRFLENSFAVCGTDTSSAVEVLPPLAVWLEVPVSEV